MVLGVSSRIVLTCALAAGLPVWGQFASAYRALGQPDLRRNGVNMVQGLEMNGPGGVASDFRHGEVHLYISDARNHRVLAWRDARAFQTGDPPALILGQPSPQSSAPRGIGARGFNTPLGLAVDPANGNLYVVDSVQNRVLRFPSPFDNPSRVEPDKVYGQLNFNNVNAGTSNATLRAPRAVAFDNLGHLWVVDSGNHRLLRFNKDALEGLEPEADLVLGQQNFSAGTSNRGSGGVSATGFDLPTALTFDGGGNLYVADFNNLRVLRFAAPLGAESAANAVYGQASLTARELPPQASARTIFGPTAVGVDGGNVYVAAPVDNRILVFAADGPPGSPAREILGQPDFTLTRPNPGSFPFASATTFASPNDIEIDPDGNLVVSDSGNNRVLSFPRGGKSATRVWGQVDFRANGANRVKPGSINSPYKVVIDYSQSPYALYVSDLNNHRVLGWRDSVRFRTGDPADLVIGQPDFDSAAPNVDSRAMANPTATSLFAPRGLALDVDGNLYVADSGNNRVLRYPRPVTQTGRITPDLVLGQTDFTTAVSAGVSASSMNAPAGLAVDPNGDLFVADSGNHRVLQFPRGSVNGAAAIRVVGQPGFITGVSPSVPSVQTLSSPQGIAVDASYTLFVADAGSNRVLVFPNTRDAATAGAAAAIVLGQSGFDTGSARGGAGGLRIPFDVALDGSGKIYVSDTGNNRVLAYPSLLFLPLTGAEAIEVIGQHDMSGTGPNWNATGEGLTTAEGLSSPLGVFVDRRDTVYIGDPGNNRVLHFLKPSLISHAANSQAGAPVARGGLANFSGASLVEVTERAGSSPLPVTMAGREIVIDDEVRVPLVAASPEKIEFQVPANSAVGPSRVALRLAETGELLAGTVVPVAATSPGLFVNNEAARGHGRIQNQDGGTNTPASAALRGTTIKIFGTGQGPVSPPVADGQAAATEGDVSTVAVPTTDGNTCLSRQPSVCVAIGNTFGEVLFSGLAANQVGVWQLTVKLPLNGPTGNAIPLRAVINGSPSNIVTVAIR